FDPTASRVVLFGGASGSNFLADTWSWDGSEWTQVADTGPAARSGHALAYDDARKCVVLFGGRGTANLLGELVWIRCGNGIGQANYLVVCPWVFLAEEEDFEVARWGHVIA